MRGWYLTFVVRLWWGVLGVLSLAELCWVNTHTTFIFWLVSTWLGPGLLLLGAVCIYGDDGQGPAAIELQPLVVEGSNYHRPLLWVRMSAAVLFVYMGLAATLFTVVYSMHSEEQLDLLAQHHWRLDTRPTRLDPLLVMQWLALHLVVVVLLFLTLQDTLMTLYFWKQQAPLTRTNSLRGRG